MWPRSLSGAILLRMSCFSVFISGNPSFLFLHQINSFPKFIVKRPVSVLEGRKVTSWISASNVVRISWAIHADRNNHLQPGQYSIIIRFSFSGFDAFIWLECRLSQAFFVWQSFREKPRTLTWRFLKNGIDFQNLVQRRCSWRGSLLSKERRRHVPFSSESETCKGYLCETSGRFSTNRQGPHGLHWPIPWLTWWKSNFYE